MAETSPRLRDALVADLIDWDDPAEADQLARGPLKDQRVVTEHLARQLGFNVWSEVADAADLHATLMTLVPELEQLLRDWPPPEDGRIGSVLAEVACKSLSDPEVYATLLAGPPAWRKAKLDESATTVEQLQPHFQRIVQRGVASAVNAMLEHWRTWDVPKLQSEWRAEKRRRDDAALEAQRQARRAMTPEERARRRADNPLPHYTPPGRTT